jgi:hypothetical protein
MATLSGLNVVKPDDRQGHSTWHYRQDIQGRAAFRALPADTQDFFRGALRAVRIDAHT